MKDFQLPERWQVEVDEDNRKIINDWKAEQDYNADLFECLEYNYVEDNGSGSDILDLDVH